MKTRIKNIFVSTILTVTMLTGALSGILPVKAGLVFAVDNTAFQTPENYPEGENPTIRIGTWYKEEYLTNLKAYLATKFPDYIFEFEYIDKTNYEPLIDSKLSCKDAPDILYVDREMALKHAVTGYIENVTDICGDFKNDAKVAFGYGNAVYAVPSTTQFECLYYNKEIFKKEAIRVPDNYKSFVWTCEFFKNDRDIEPVAISLRNPYALANTALAILSADYFSTDRGRGFGGRLQYGRTTFEEEILPYMDDWQNLIDDGIFTKDMYTKDEMSAIEEFVAGQAAMVVGGPETYFSIMSSNPEMEVGTMPFFGMGGSGMAIIGGCDVGFALNKVSPHKAEAKAVLAGLASEEGQRAIWLDRPGSQSYLKGVTFENSEVYEGVQECLDGGLAFTPWMDWGQDLNKAAHYTLGRELQKVLLKRERTQDALKNVDKVVYQILREG